MEGEEEETKGSEHLNFLQVSEPLQGCEWLRWKMKFGGKMKLWWKKLFWWQVGVVEDEVVHEAVAEYEVVEWKMIGVVEKMSGGLVSTEVKISDSTKPNLVGSREWYDVSQRAQ